MSFFRKLSAICTFPSSALAFVYYDISSTYNIFHKPATTAESCAVDTMVLWIAHKRPSVDLSLVISPPPVVYSLLQQKLFCLAELEILIARLPLTVLRFQLPLSFLENLKAIG